MASNEAQSPWVRCTNSVLVRRYPIETIAAITMEVAAELAVGGANAAGRVGGEWFTV